MTPSEPKFITEARAGASVQNGDVPARIETEPRGWQAITDAAVQHGQRSEATTADAICMASEIAVVAAHLTHAPEEGQRWWPVGEVSVPPRRDTALPAAELAT